MKRSIIVKYVIYSSGSIILNRASDSIQHKLDCDNPTLLYVLVQYHTMGHLWNEAFFEVERISLRLSMSFLEYFLFFLDVIRSLNEIYFQREGQWNVFLIQ